MTCTKLKKHIEALQTRLRHVRQFASHLASVGSVSDVAASGVGRVAVLFVNLGFVMAVARALSKEAFGAYVYYMALADFVTLIMTAGTNAIVTQRAASGVAKLEVVAGAAVLHRLVALAAVIGAAFLLVLTWPTVVDHPRLLLIALCVSLMAQVAGVWKQTLLGAQRFWWVTASEMTALAAKIVVSLILIARGWGAEALFVGLAIGVCAEGLLTLRVLSSRVGIRATPRWNASEVWAQASAGIPLLGTALLNQSLSRMDWLLLGMLKPPAVVAEYSLAYRMFEASWLPHATLSVVLLPKLSRLLKGTGFRNETRERLTSLHRVVTSISILLPIWLVLGWNPILDTVTSNKYGASNLTTVELLAVAVPLAAGCGIMWNIAMARGLGKRIFFATGCSAVSNVLLNLTLIPRFGAVGAAVANSIAFGVQYTGLLSAVREDLDAAAAIRSTAMCTVTAVFALVAARFVVGHWILQCAVATVVCCGVIVGAKMVGGNDISALLGEQAGEAGRALHVREEAGE